MARTRRNPSTREIAQTIIQQIHTADRFAFPFWAVHPKRVFALGETPDRAGGVQFDVKGATFRGRVLIELTWDDTYGVSLWKVSRSAAVPSKRVWGMKGVYVDQLYELLDRLVMKRGPIDVRMNPRRRRPLARRGRKGRRRNPLIGNDGSVFRRRAEQSTLAKNVGMSLDTLREMFGENFDPRQVAEVYAASKVGMLSAEATTKALHAIREGTYGGLPRAAVPPAPAPTPAPPLPSPTSAPKAARDEEMDRDTAIARIREGLRKRSGVTWSVTGGRGTVWGWITITSPPKRRSGYSEMTKEDQARLSKLLDKDVHAQGESIPASYEYRMEAVDRAEGRTPRVIGEQYWD